MTEAAQRPSERLEEVRRIILGSFQAGLDARLERLERQLALDRREIIERLDGLGEELRTRVSELEDSGAARDERLERLGPLAGEVAEVSKLASSTQEKLGALAKTFEDSRGRMLERLDASKSEQARGLAEVREEARREAERIAATLAEKADREALSLALEELARRMRGAE